MTSFEIVAIVLCLFLGFGIAMGVLIVSAFSRRRAYQYLEGDDSQSPPGLPGEDEKPPWWQDG
jgi:hypothetical protein